jgi:predicted DNA-binding transcriptional regulator AlpA
MSKTVVESRFISIDEAAAVMGVSRASIFNFRGRRDFPPCIKLGLRRVGVERAAFEAWLATRPAA